MHSDVEEVKSRLNIVDVVGEYVRLNKAGANWKGLCPFHHEKSPSFMVHEEKQIYHCFGCQKGGDVLSFVMEIESMDFREALKMLAEKAGVQLNNQMPQKGTDNKKKILEILELATKFYEVQLWKGSGREKIMGYLRERGLNDESIRNFRLGYAPKGWDNITKFLTGRGYKVEDLEKAGLIIRKNSNSQSEIRNSDENANPNYKLQITNYYDRFRNRIMFPICDGMGKVIGYSARAIPGEDEAQAKYINTPETSVYHKSDVLYGLHLAKQAIKQKDAVLLVEGNMDVIASHQAGIKNTVAVSGTALTYQQIDILKRYAATIQMLFDMDSAGNQALKRSADLAFNKSVDVSVVRLGDGKDAADVVQKDASKLVAAVNAAMPAMEYFFQAALGEYDLHDPQQKKQFVNELGEHVAQMTNQIEKMHWVKKIAHEIDSQEEVVLEALSLFKEKGQHNFENNERRMLEPSFETGDDLIRNKLVGMMLSGNAIWKWCTETYENEPYLQNDKFLQKIFQDGKRYNYTCNEYLSSIEDEELRSQISKLVFDAKFRFADGGHAIERDSGEARDLAEQYMKRFIEELQKRKLRSIIRDIKKAEQSGEKELLGKLMREFTELSQRLT